MSSILADKVHNLIPYVENHLLVLSCLPVHIKFLDCKSAPTIELILMKLGVVDLASIKSCLKYLIKIPLGTT